MNFHQKMKTNCLPLLKRDEFFLLLLLFRSHVHVFPLCFVFPGVACVCERFSSKDIVFGVLLFTQPIFNNTFKVGAKLFFPPILATSSKELIDTIKDKNMHLPDKI